MLASSEHAAAVPPTEPVPTAEGPTTAHPLVLEHPEPSKEHRYDHSTQLYADCTQNHV